MKYSKAANSFEYKLTYEYLFEINMQNWCDCLHLTK